MGSYLFRMQCIFLSLCFTARKTDKHSYRLKDTHRDNCGHSGPWNLLPGPWQWSHPHSMLHKSHPPSQWYLPLWTWKDMIITAIADDMHNRILIIMAINTYRMSVIVTLRLFCSLATAREQYIVSDSVVVQWLTHSMLEWHTATLLLFLISSQMPEGGTSCLVVKALPDEG